MAQALKMCVGCLTPNGCSDCLDLHEWIMEHLSFEQVVHCRNCKYADKYNHCEKVSFWNGADDYCSHGELRNENGGR